MKKLTTTLFFLLVFTLFACTNGIQEPSNIGKVAFDLVYNLQEKSLSHYQDKLMSIEAFRKLGKDTVYTTTQESRNSISALSIQKFNQLKEEDYTKLKKQGVEYGIDWATIEYTDFTYELIKRDGTQICEGKVYFKSATENFYIKTIAVLTREGYLLLRLEKLSKV